MKVMMQAHNPVAGYNPMTSQPVLETVESMLAIDAEAVALEAATEAAGTLGLPDDFILFLTVATPGRWTTRLESEVQHRLAPSPWTGGAGSILLWTAEPTDAGTVRRETVAQLVRAASLGAPSTAREAVRIEGLAYALTGSPGERSDAVAEAIEIVGDDEAMGTKAALLYGDDVARAMGFVPLGLGALEGYRHAIATAVMPASRGRQ